LATHVKAGIQLVKLIKDLGIKNQIIASDALASTSFLQGFQNEPKEHQNPGFYTDGLYVATPLIFDSANEQTQYLRDRYQTVYDEELTDWGAAFAYDAIMMLVDALKKADISGTKTTLVEDRQKLRDYLASLTHVDKAIEGIAGFNYFDEHGTAQKPIFMGVYKKGLLISAFTQFQDVPNLSDISYLKKTTHDEPLLLMGNKHQYKTHVVYTGLKVNKISDVDLTSLTYTLDFYLWFRFKGSINPENLDFLNSVKPIELGEPIEKIVEGDINYRLYHVNGRFKGNFMPKYRLFGLHIFGVSFRHRQLPRYHLIYVMDSLGMALFSKDALVKKLIQAQVLSPKYQGTISQAWFSQETSTKELLGNPKYLNAPNVAVEYSRFNMGILVKEDTLSLLHLIPPNAAQMLWFLSLLLVILLLIVSQIQWFQRFFALLFVLKMVLVFSLLLSTELILCNWFIAPDIPASYLEAATLIFEMLWWIIGAIFIHLGSHYFLWTPLYQKSGRPLPRLVHNLWVFTIYALAFLGMVAFVFDRPITSLLATSGVLAMVIGLAAKMNLSNIVSGLAINLERPFRVGEWVKISHYDEGVVEDINWRATQIRTRTGLTLIIPNSIVAEQDIINFSAKDNLWLRPTIYVDPRHPPEMIRKILDSALLSVEGILTEPAPFSLYVGINDWAASYWMYVCIEDYSKKYRILQSLWNNAWAALSRAGIQAAIRKMEVYTFIGSQERKWVPITELPETFES
jgi:potassium efflux system protein